MKNALLFLLVFMSSVTWAQTNVSGLISTNTTWTPAGNPYIITGNTVVNNGVQLTVEPGVEVRFNANRSLLVNGTMQAVGTETDTVVFTANQSNPQPGYWGQIAFSDMSIDYDSIAETGNLMRYCKVEYGGGQGADANVYLESSSILIERSTILRGEKNGIQGVGAGTTTTVIRYNRIELNLLNGIHHEPGSNSQPVGDVVIHGNHIVFNGEVGVKAAIEDLWQYQFGSIVTITMNEISNSTEGIRCQLLLNSLIQSNNIHHNSDYGIYTSFSAGNVSNNHIKESKIGIYSFINVEVEGNTVSDCDSIGIRTGNCTVKRNLCFNDNIGISTRTTHFGLGPDTIRNNILVGSGGRCAMSVSPHEPHSNGDPYCARNVIVDNACSSFIVEFTEGEEYQSMVHNTIVRNNTANFNTAAVSYNLTGASETPLFYGNNIYNNGSAYEMRCNDQLNINAQNCYWGSTVEQEIEDVVYHFIDNGNLAFVDYSNFQTTPDTTAPVTPPRNVSKVDLGNGQIKLCWDSNLEVDLAGYRVYYGDPTGYSFSNFIDVGNVNTYTLSGISINDSIAITAYDIFADEFEDQFDGNESWFTYAEDTSLNPNFSYSTDGLTADFNLLATNADTIAWDFGEATAFNDPTPQHTFSNDSTYEVCLTIGNPCAGLETVCQQVTVSCASSFDLIVQGDLEFCEGDSVLLRAQPGLSDYQWNTGAVTATIYATEEGDYYASGMSGVCEFVSDTVTVELIEVSPTITFNENELTCPETFVSYQWYLNDTIIPGATSQTYTATVSGNYTVQVEDDNGCVGTSFILEFTLQVGIAEYGQQVPFTVYPNPSQGEFLLEMNQVADFEIEVLNTLGQSIFAKRLSSSDKVPIQVSAAGIYHLVVGTEEAVYSEKVIVE